LAEAALLREGAAFGVQAADRGACRRVHAQVQPGALKQLQPAELRFGEANAPGHDAAVAVHDDQRRLVVAVGVPTCAGGGNQEQQRQEDAAPHQNYRSAQPP
jgi:hypothetical protein